MKKILIVLTSHASLGNTGKPTGLWLEELAVPYWYLRDQGHEVTLASIAGGEVPVDPGSMEAAAGRPPAVERFLNDQASAAALQETQRLDGCHAGSFNALFLPGGHGTMWDLPSSVVLARLTAEVFDGGRLVAAVCHGPAGLVSVNLVDGSPLVAGRRVTAFTDEEEAAVGLTGVVPFLLEQRLRELGAQFVSAPKFTSNVVRDGNLITGQNPQSSEAIAHAIGEALDGR